MDERTLKVIASARGADPHVGELFDQHQSLARKVSALSERPHLTPEEILDLARMKKEKLKLKDALEGMLNERASA